MFKKLWIVISSKGSELDTNIILNCHTNRPYTLCNQDFLLNQQPLVIRRLSITYRLRRNAIKCNKKTHPTLFIYPGKKYSTPKCFHWSGRILFNRPGVARAVFQTPLSLINLLSQWSFVKIYSKYSHSQSVKARVLHFGEKVHLPPLVTCNMSHVTCHFFPYYFTGQSSEASRCRVCYQWGFPCLVYLDIKFV